jgi:hypothetical protein
MTEEAEENQLLKMRTAEKEALVKAKNDFNAFLVAVDLDKLENFQDIPQFAVNVRFWKTKYNTEKEKEKKEQFIDQTLLTLHEKMDKIQHNISNLTTEILSLMQRRTKVSPPMVGIPVALTTTPSSVKSENIQGKQGDVRKFSLCSNLLALATVVEYYSVDVSTISADIQNATTAFYLMFQEYCGKGSDLCGAFCRDNKKSEKFNEPELTPFLAAEVQKILLMFQNNYNYSVQHQTCNRKPEGYFDIAGFEVIPDGLIPDSMKPLSRMKRTLYPIWFLEYGKADCFTLDQKRPQASEYANFLLRMMPTRENIPVWTPVLGVILLDLLTIEIRIYSLSRDSSSHPKVPEIVIYSGKLNEVDGFLKMLNLIHFYSHLVSKLIRRTYSEMKITNSQIFDDNMLSKPFNNVLVTDKTPYPFELSPYTVFKVFDAREKTILVKRQSTYYLDERFTFIFKNCKRVIHEKDLSLISYDWIPGKHFPTEVRHFIDILFQLAFIHSQSLVHGDIRPANLVFASPGPPQKEDMFRFTDLRTALEETAASDGGEQKEKESSCRTSNFCPCFILTAVLL